MDKVLLFVRFTLWIVRTALTDLRLSVGTETSKDFDDPRRDTISSLSANPWSEQFTEILFPNVAIWYIYRERERKRDRERQRERQRERKREKERERKREKEREREREREILWEIEFYTRGGVLEIVDIVEQLQGESFSIISEWKLPLKSNPSSIRPTFQPILPYRSNLRVFSLDSRISPSNNR